MTDTNEIPNELPLHLRGAAIAAAAAPAPAATSDYVAVVAAPETPEQRMARLRAMAVAQAQKESDEEVLAKMLREEKAKLSGIELPPDETVLPVDSRGFPEDYVWLTIYPGREKHDLSYVPLSLGGFCIKTPRGDRVALPRVFMTECLDHAMEEVEVQRQGGLITRPQHRFPYQYHGPATTEEYQQFIASEKAKAMLQQGAIATK